MTHFVGVNWLAVLLAALGSMVLGMGWYSALGKQWMNALGKTREELMPDGKASPIPFVVAAICQLIMAYFLLLLTRTILDSSATDIQIWDAVMIGGHMWIGFIMTSMVLNHAYQGQKYTLTLIDGGYLLGVMIVQGVILGLLA